MNTHSEDQALVMLAHGQLPLGSTLATRIHVTVCTRCQVRLSKIEGASRLLADTIRGQELRRWQLPSAVGAVTAAKLTTVWLTVLLALTLVVAVQAVRTMTRPAHLSPKPVPGMGCRPDLPSDKCR